MSKLKIGSITFIVNGYTVNNTLPYFQKAIPEGLRSRFGKATVKIRLRAENGNYAVQCHRLKERFESLFKAMKADATLTPSENKVAALALLATHGLKAGDGLEEMPMPPGWKGSWDPTPHISFFEDEIRDKFDQPTPLTNAAFKALNNQLPVLLSEAFTVYLENHTKGNNKDFQEDQAQHWRKLIALVGDMALVGLTRVHARQYRDHRLSTGVKTTTVMRELGVLKAVVNAARREIPLSMTNPFDSLPIQGAYKDANKRIPHTPSEWKSLVNAAVKADDEKRNIVVVLAFTGARLAEVVGLRKQDFDPVAKTIYICPHASRSLKTTVSERLVPLLPLALDALKAQLKRSPTEFLFPCYANVRKTKSNGASATLNKWAKKFAANKTMHTFRHTYRDAMRAVLCQDALSEAICGWSGKKAVSAGYGVGYPLEVKLEWLERAYTKLSDLTPF